MRTKRQNGRNGEEFQFKNRQPIFFLFSPFIDNKHGRKGMKKTATIPFSDSNKKKRRRRYATTQHLATLEFIKKLFIKYMPYFFHKSYPYILHENGIVFLSDIPFDSYICKKKTSTIEYWSRKMLTEITRKRTNDSCVCVCSDARAKERKLYNN